MTRRKGQSQIIEQVKRTLRGVDCDQINLGVVSFNMSKMNYSPIIFYK